MSDELTKIKIENATMAEKLDNLCEKVDKIDNNLSEYIKYERKREQQMKNNFAGKWVEGLTLGMLLAGAGAVITVLIQRI